MIVLKLQWIVEGWKGRMERGVQGEDEERGGGCLGGGYGPTIN